MVGSLGVGWGLGLGGRGYMSTRGRNDGPLDGSLSTKERNGGGLGAGLR